MFYCTLKDNKFQCKSQENTIVVWVRNEKLVDEIVYKFGLGTCNERREKCVYSAR